MPTRADTECVHDVREAISPELVLVDPVLAAEARSRLPDRPPFPPDRAPDHAADWRRLLEPVGTAAHGAEATCSRLTTDFTQLAYPSPPRDSSVPRRRLLRPILLGYAVGAATAALAVGAGGLGGDRVLFGAPSLAAPQSQQVAKGTAAAPQTRPEGSAQRAPAPSAPSPAEQAPPPPGTAPSGPAAEPPATPASREFVWPEVASAGAYEFQLFRGDALVFRTRVSVARLELPPQWRFGGKTQRLAPGRYRWYVWVVRAGSTERAEKALIQARLDVRP